MGKYSEISEGRLGTCHPKLQRLFRAVLPLADHSIICGFRDQVAQDVAFASGKSQVKWPHGKHNVFPSRAVDVAPWPIDWSDVDRFKKFAEVVNAKADEIGIRVIWGGSWENFKDWPHWELHKEEE